ncbi:hypothetical protein RvY_13621-1 [Ramazzottius varieornatus]|uniref:Amino acid permease/ SLC12A domain-containing protein n=1 Tax=Ramazzottius varieornatus TaxID=947166 RepID=A0A1D1VQB5_RAMVA|nr:hypothetical protein RvY_13621-1 [Ramazzottius varieornatus]
MGASYLFAYSVFGEFVAFLIGWNDLLASFITLALTAQTLTHHLDVLSGGRLDSWMRKDLGVFPWDQSFAPDIVACFSLLLCGAAVCRCKNLSLTIVVCLFVLHMLIIIASKSKQHLLPRRISSTECTFHSGVPVVIPRESGKLGQ